MAMTKNIYIWSGNGAGVEIRFEGKSRGPHFHCNLMERPFLPWHAQGLVRQKGRICNVFDDLKRTCIHMLSK